MSGFADYFSAYWHVWLSEVLVLGVFLSLIFLNWKRISRFVVSHMLLSAVILWIAGTVLYSIGFAFEGSGHSLTTFLLRAAQASLGMFISENELVEVSPFYKENALYMLLFAVTHLCAVVLSAIFILNTVGFRLKHFFLLFNEYMQSRRADRDTYLFWGFSDESITLARDIRSRFKDARIVFIRSTGEANLGERLEVTELVNAGTGATKSLQITKMVGSIEDAIVSYVPADLNDGIKMGRLRKILERTTNISFFFLTPDEKLNVKLGAIIYADPFFAEDSARNVSIYTMSRNGGNNRILQDHIVLQKQKGCRAQWHFVDTSYLSVTALKYRYETHPIQCVPASRIDNGVVDGTFSAMVLGFGNTGQEMYRYLYEFGTFPGVGGGLCPKRVILVDRDMDRLAGPMCISSPAVFHTDAVKMIAEEAGSVGFWRSVREYAPSINVVAIALGSDEANINMTMDVYRALLQYSPEKPRNVKIFLRIYSTENEKSVLRLAADYNSHKDETGIEIVPFGSISEVFSVDVIMGADMLKAAREFNYNFDLLRGRNADCDADSAWARDFNVGEYLDRYKAAPLAIEELTRQIVQCHSDTLHIGTMLALAGLSPRDKDGIAAFADVIRSRETGTSRYSAASASQQALIDNLARCAHGRLTESHWLLGYRYADAAVIAADPMDAARQRLTSYMKPWADCSAEERMLAYSVVDTSIIIAQKYYC